MPAPASVRTLHDHLDIARRHRWTLTVITVLGLVGGVGYATLTPKQYVSQTAVLVQPTGAEEVAVAQGRSRTEINLDTEAQLVTSTEVASMAAEWLGEPTETPAELARRVSVTVPPNTSILTIGFTDEGPQRAQAGAEAFTTAYLNHRAGSAQSRLTGQIEAVEGELETLRQERNRLSDQMDMLNSSSSRYAALRNDRDLIDNEITELTTGHSQLRTAADSVGSGRVISDATTPTAAASPHQLVSTTGGLFVGFLVAWSVVAVRTRFGVRIWHPGDIVRRCRIEVLATIPEHTESSAHDVFGAFGPGGRVFGSCATRWWSRWGDLHESSWSRVWRRARPQAS